MKRNTLTALPNTALAHITGGCKLVSASPVAPAYKNFDLGSTLSSMIPDVALEATASLPSRLDGILASLGGVDPSIGSAIDMVSDQIDQIDKLDIATIDEGIDTLTSADLGANLDAPGLPPNWCGTPSQAGAQDSGNWEDCEDCDAPTDTIQLETSDGRATPSWLSEATTLAVADVAPQAASYGLMAHEAPTPEVRDHRASASDTMTAPNIRDHR